jgi:hypothetical protein
MHFPTVWPQQIMPNVALLENVQGLSLQLPAVRYMVYEVVGLQHMHLSQKMRMLVNYPGVRGDTNSTAPAWENEPASIRLTSYGIQPHRKIKAVRRVSKFSVTAT